MSPSASFPRLLLGPSLPTLLVLLAMLLPLLLAALLLPLAALLLLLAVLLGPGCGTGTRSCDSRTGLVRRSSWPTPQCCGTGTGTSLLGWAEMGWTVL